MFENLDVFRMSTALARHAGQRQAVAAQNVANADTPGYVARDLPSFTDSYLPQAGTAPRATRARHMHGVQEGSGAAVPVAVRGTASPDGNGVSLETEMLKSVSAKRSHDRALAIYKSALTVLRTAVRS